MNAISGLKSALLPLAAGAYGTGTHEYGVVALAGIALLAIIGSLFFSWLGWRKRQYMVGAEDIRLESGILSRTARSVPYERIQDVSLEQKLLPRLFGLVDVRFETGAGGKDELRLSYVLRPEGERLRELVRERREDGAPLLPPQNSGAIGRDAAPAGPSAAMEPLFAMTNGRVLTLGLFEFSLVIFAVALGAAQQFDFLLPFDPWDQEQWLGYFSGGGQWIGDMGWLGRLGAMLGGLGLLGLMGIATGVARTFAREYGFRLDRTARGFRRRRGLFNLTDVVMPAHRVQAAMFKTGLLRARFGWHSLEFVSLAQDSKEQASHIVAPLATMDEAWPIAETAGLRRPAPDIAWHRHDPRAWMAGLVIIAAILMVVTLLLAAQVAPAAAYSPILWLPVLGGLIYFSWARHRYALDDCQIFLGTGTLIPRLTIAQRSRLQSVELVQGPIARRLGYATLNFGLAGGSMALEGIKLDDAVALRDAVLSSISAVDFSDLPQ